MSIQIITENNSPLFKTSDGQKFNNRPDAIQHESYLQGLTKIIAQMQQMLANGDVDHEWLHDFADEFCGPEIDDAETVLKQQLFSEQEISDNNIDVLGVYLIDWTLPVKRDNPAITPAVFQPDSPDAWYRHGHCEHSDNKPLMS